MFKLAYPSQLPDVPIQLFTTGAAYRLGTAQPLLFCCLPKIVLYCINRQAPYITTLYYRINNEETTFLYPDTIWRRRHSMSSYLTEILSCLGVQKHVIKFRILNMVYTRDHGSKNTLAYQVLADDLGNRVRSVRLVSLWLVQ